MRAPRRRRHRALLAALGTLVVAVSPAMVPAAAAQEDPVLGSIGGEVVVDVDGDGRRTGVDVPVSGVVVTLTGSAGDGTGVDVVAATDEVGRFRFEDVPAGEYEVAVRQPAAWREGAALAGDSGTVLAHDRIGAVRVAGADVGGTTFLLGAGSIVGQVGATVGMSRWIVPGAEVVVRSARSGSQGVVGADAGASVEVDRRVEADDTGAFRVDGLPVGTYVVSVEAARLGASVGAGTAVVEIGVDGDDEVDASVEVVVVSAEVPVALGATAGTATVVDPAGRAVATLPIDGTTEALELPIGGWTLRLEDRAAGLETAVTREVDVVVTAWREVQAAIVADGPEASSGGGAGGRGGEWSVVVLAGALAIVGAVAIVSLAVGLLRRGARLHAR